ncbi:SDR family oxidoreductase [Idiomarina sp. UBA3162]|uniref:SDR family oxidoreductase n=1 Tax=unclassified Idiomarina TaxID=2614829 RepID=UPI000C8B1C2C|nr:SDR family oxidoreductase [Idiomarina sp. UBA3162]MAD53606.1 short-chain dehydrogenase [Idiomarinaceae bacterium]MEC7642234.1 SDR family oxidoreductase [Pseudomonadota bacterium]|tara:strand:+ start:11069 stop:11743 length:675 start_codon:yes stop_codon:yes gene_type:complete
MAKVLLITGASSGIGEATVKEAVKQGYKVVATARSEDKLQALANELGAEHVLPIAADVTDYQQLERVVQQTVDQFGQLDAVFANAGKGLNAAGTENGDPNEWREMIDLNINALLYTAKLTLPHLKKSTGHFIMTGSAAGRTAIKGSVYGASKWFVHGFAQNLAEEMREWSGRCTVIAPGMVNTPFFDEPKPDKLDPQDVADAVLHALNAHPRNCVREVFLMPGY